MTASHRAGAIHGTDEQDPNHPNHSAHPAPPRPDEPASAATPGLPGQFSGPTPSAQARGAKSCPEPDPDAGVPGPGADAGVPVITIDGPTASGKGTIAQRVASALGWHVLDSGALYRLTALAVQRAGGDGSSEDQAAALARALDVCFRGGTIRMDGEDVTRLIRQECIGNLASRVAAWPAVRSALLARQRDFRRAPGLVADGRDMGTVVFPDATLKIFLDANVAVRAQRRHKQLKDKGISANLSDLLEDLRARDARDRDRALAPLVAAADAVTVDSSHAGIDDTVRQVLDLWSARGLARQG